MSFTRLNRSIEIRWAVSLPRQILFLTSTNAYQLVRLSVLPRRPARTRRWSRPTRAGTIHTRKAPRSSRQPPPLELLRSTASFDRIFSKTERRYYALPRRRGRHVRRDPCLDWWHDPEFCSECGFEDTNGWDGTAPRVSTEDRKRIG